MAHVWLKRSRWYMGFVDEFGVPRQEPMRVAVSVDPRTGKPTKSSRKDAETFADNYERKCERVRLGLEEHDREDPLFEDGAKTYLEDVARAHGSYASIEGRFRNHLVPAFEGKRLSQINGGSIRAFLTKKAQKGQRAELKPDISGAARKQKDAPLSPQTRKHLLNDLHAFFRWALEEAKLYSGSNPAGGDLRGAVTVPERTPRYLELEQVPMLLACIKDHYRGFVAVAVYCGLRAGEIKALLVTNVDLERGLLFVQRSNASETTKSKKDRLVPIPPGLVPYLRVELGRARSELLFPGVDGALMSKNRKLSKVIQTALKKAGLLVGWDHKCRRKGCGYLERRADSAVGPCPKCSFRLWPKPVPIKFSFKDLRSTFGTHATEMTNDIRFTQKVLGHSDVATTEGRYAHARVARLVTQAQQVSYPVPTGPRETASEGDLAMTKSPVVPMTNVASMAQSQTRGTQPSKPRVVGSSPAGRAPPSGTLCHSVALPASPETSAEPQEHGLAAISTFSPLVSYPAPTAVPGGRLLTVAEVAEALKLTRDGVYFHIRSGRLKAVQSGALLHVRPEDLAEFNATARRRRS